jgi:hypothetical protein
LEVFRDAYPIAGFERGKTNKGAGQLNSEKKSGGATKMKNKTKNKPKNETKGKTKNKGKKEWKQQ